MKFYLLGIIVLYGTCCIVEVAYLFVRWRLNIYLHAPLMYAPGSLDDSNGLFLYLSSFVSFPYICICNSNMETTTTPTTTRTMATTKEMRVRGHLHGHTEGTLYLSAYYSLDFIEFWDRSSWV